MTTETDLWQTAWIIAEQHGTDGPAFAVRMADSFKLGHKIDAHQAWLSIAAKVAMLIETNVSRGSRQH
ncbi:hypothetical protein SSBR45G_60750 [Bradyrhizobium sp. SSBR45G]|uniref:hypothetical protein n=1 Tax=unclassified Bradyrhizobium TaxID=2631580 RepID=UPI0023429033|nr:MULTISPECIES: hypothetical protein [unclassified Bradyrhizobium]GLH81166.1 hypothetical protein SSBR45G_60750 [Bradyrhizobium sp. SSBR45G]GLH88567.1 hypothetical protein SSBR45R_60280 [Bradyrhizobium sp. SSBR45R]